MGLEERHRTEDTEGLGKRVGVSAFLGGLLVIGKRKTDLKIQS
jgi:hypothetical protein